MKKIKQYINKCLKGEEKLWIVFWIWFVLVGTIISILSQLSLASFLLVIFPKDESILFKGLIIVVGTGFIFFSALYSIWLLVSLIKCRKNVKNPIWTKVFIYSFAFLILFSFIGEIFFPENENTEVTEQLES